jgi:hypothetical protein
MAHVERPTDASAVTHKEARVIGAAIRSQPAPVVWVGPEILKGRRIAHNRLPKIRHFVA